MNNQQLVAAVILGLIAIVLTVALIWKLSGASAPPINLKKVGWGMVIVLVIGVVVWWVIYPLVTQENSLPTLTTGSTPTAAHGPKIFEAAVKDATLNDPRVAPPTQKPGENGFEQPGTLWAWFVIGPEKPYTLPSRGARGLTSFLVEGADSVTFTCKICREGGHSTAAGSCIDHHTMVGGQSGKPVKIRDWGIVSGKDMPTPWVFSAAEENTVVRIYKEFHD